MNGLATSEIILFVVASFIAIVALVRLMRGRRDQLLGEFRAAVELEKHRKLQEDKRKKRAAQKENRKAS